MDDSDGFRIVPNVDYTKVGPLNHKRTLAFINHFITHTVRFLNRFSCVCEEKLSDLSGRIQRVEIMMNILEAKLSSIPGLEDVQAPAATSQPSPQPTQASPNAAPAAPTAPPATPTVAPTVEQNSGPPAPPQEPEPEPEAPRCPPGALKGKMLGDGLDPSLLENPDAPVPGGGPPPGDDDSDEESSSASSFSDDD